MIRIYVSTYAKYNAGNLSGLWIDLPQGERKLCKLLDSVRGSERFPEYMILDSETDSDFHAIGESDSIWDLNKELQEIEREAKITKKALTMTETEKEVVEEYKRIGEKGEFLEYLIDQISAAYKLECGKIVIFRKPSIETRFCFGVGQNGISTNREWENAAKLARDAEEKDYFINENMRQFDELENELNGKEHPPVCERDHINTELFARIAFLPYYTRYFEAKEAGRVFEITEKDVAGLKKTIKAEREKLLKRLEAWYKRYGKKGIKTWTYLVD